MWYVYALLDPATKTRRYYGMTQDPVGRLDRHLNDAVRRRRYPVYEWILCLRQKNLRPEIEVLAAFQTKHAAGSCEVEMIASARKNNEDILNVSGGGTGGEQPPEVRARIGRKIAALFEDGAYRERHTSLRQTEEYRMRMAARHQNEDWEKARVSKITETLNKPEVKEIFRQKQSEYMSDPKNREKISVKIRSSEGLSFDSRLAAAQHYGVTATAIYKCIRMGRPLKREGKEVFFEALGEKKTRSKKFGQKKIKIVETGEIFESVAALVEEVGCHPNEPARCLKLGRKLLKKWTLEKV